MQRNNPEIHLLLFAGLPIHQDAIQVLASSLHRLGWTVAYTEGAIAVYSANVFSNDFGKI